MIKLPIYSFYGKLFTEDLESLLLYFLFVISLSDIIDHFLAMRNFRYSQGDVMKIY